MSSLYVINNFPPIYIYLQLALLLFNHLIKLVTPMFACGLCGQIKRIFITYFVETNLKEKNVSTYKRNIRERKRET